MRTHSAGPPAPDIIVDPNHDLSPPLLGKDTLSVRPAFPYRHDYCNTNPTLTCHSLSFPISAGSLFEAEGEKAKSGAVLPHGKSNKRQQDAMSHFAAIERLPNEVLTEIFIFDRLISISLSQSYWFPRQLWKWQRLAHVCRKWRHIIFDSPRSLDLRLFCTFGTPVKDNLDCWPAFPIDMHYRWGGNYANSNIEYKDDIMAALQNSDRICKIRLNVTTSLFENLTSLSRESFPMLEHLELGSFPNLHVLHVAKIAFPAFQRVLPSARNLVDLHLEALPSSGYITPAALLAFLPVMTRLESLYLHFHSPISRPISGGYRPAPQGRAVLHSLKWFTFYGVSEDLECLLSGIDAPGIMYINVTFFNQTTIFDTSQFLQFTSRTETQMSHDTAELYCLESDISMTLTRRGRPLQMMLRSYVCG
ncbi:hypothetical protein BGW80DRAFT_1461921 [Lactifluus volemus]|nr:hypothetical protein BGW80DRAFT_1461921 [Lactifluus volemus]